MTAHDRTTAYVSDGSASRNRIGFNRLISVTRDSTSTTRFVAQHAEDQKSNRRTETVQNFVKKYK